MKWDIPKDITLADTDFLLSQDTHLLIEFEFLQFFMDGRRSQAGYSNYKTYNKGCFSVEITLQKLVMN